LKSNRLDDKPEIRLARCRAAVVEKHEARVGDVVEDRDRCRPTSVQLARDAPMARELFPLANDDRKSQVRK
jgi:hypothetical protein